MKGLESASGHTGSINDDVFKSPARKIRGDKHRVYGGQSVYNIRLKIRICKVLLYNSRVQNSDFTTTIPKLQIDVINNRGQRNFLQSK